MRSKRLNVPIEKAAELMDRELHDTQQPLEMPDFYDYQDFVNPVFRIELELVERKQGQQSLQFSLKDEDIIDSFQRLFARTVDSMNGMLRPGSAKIVDLSPHEHKREFDEIRRIR